MLKLGYFGEPVGDLVGGIAEFFLVLAYIDFEKYIGFYPLLPRTAAYLTGGLKLIDALYHINLSDYFLYLIALQMTDEMKLAVLEIELGAL